MAWGPQLGNVPSRVSFLPACFEITTSQGYCTRGPRRQVKREEEGAGLPALKLRRNMRMTGCSGVEGCMCRGVRRRPWLQGWVGGPLGPRHHLAGHLTLPIGIFMSLVPQHLPPLPQTMKQSAFLLEAICENNGLYLKNKLSCNTREGHCDRTPRCTPRRG